MGQLRTRRTFGSRGTTAWIVTALVCVLMPLCACRRSERAGSSQTTGAEVPVPSAPPPFPIPPVLPGTPDIPSLVAKVKPGVVNITTTAEEVRRGPADLFEFFFGPRPRGGGDEVVKKRALGSGFVIDAAGHIATNAHVVAGASSVRVKLSDGRELNAKIKGTDERLDVAVLELEGAKNVPFVALGSSDALRVGEYVVAIGNPFGLGDTVTMGIVSAKGREIGAGPYDDFIQTDASINPGNSGGPLFNLKGEVIGINTAIAAQGRGLGFAIPIDAVKDVLPQLLATGKVQRGRLGVVIQPVDDAIAKALGMPKASGALINEVEAGGPAAKAGIEPGDVILMVDNSPIESAHELPRLIARHRPGAKVTLDVFSKGKGQRTVTVTLGEVKEEAAQARQTVPSSGDEKHELGIVLSDDPRAGGAVVRDVQANGLAAGLLEPGDVIIEVDGAQVKTAREAADRMRRQTGRPALLRVRRNGRSRFVAIQRP